MQRGNGAAKRKADGIATLSKSGGSNNNSRSGDRRILFHYYK